MTTYVADDFAAIARAMAENAGIEPDDYCAACEDSGWKCYALGFADPHFRECSVCGNPKGRPSP